MYQNKKILAFIPARGNSKGIPNKNLYLINGKPLIQYTLECAAKAEYIDEIIISTDSEKIANFCTSLPDISCTIVKRPPELSLDTSKTIEAVMHTLETIKAQHKEFDYLLILQPTSPLRRSFQIQEIIEKTIDRDLDGCVSVRPVQDHPILMRFADDEMNLTNVLNQSSTVRRQDMPKCYYVDGSLYIVKIDTLSLETSLNDFPNGYLNTLTCNLDINTLEDIKICEQFLKLGIT